MFCRDCGNPCSDTAKFCPKCGTTLAFPIHSEEQAAPAPIAQTPAEPVQAIPTQAVPTQAVPTQAAPTQAAPTQAAPTQAAPTPAASAIPVATGACDKFRLFATTPLFFVTAIVGGVYALFTLISSIISLTAFGDMVSVINMFIMVPVLTLISVSLFQMHLKAKAFTPVYDVSMPFKLLKTAIFTLTVYSLIVYLFTLISIAQDIEKGGFFFHIAYYFLLPFMGISDDMDVIAAFWWISWFLAGPIYTMYYLSIIRVANKLSNSTKTGVFTPGSWLVVLTIFVGIVAIFSLIGHFLKVAVMSDLGFLAKFFNDGDIVFAMVTSLIGASFDILVILNLFKYKNIAQN